MKTNRKKLFIFILVASLILLSCVGFVRYNSEPNQLKHLKDGFNDPIIMQIYQGDIDDVYTMTNAKTITIRYVDIDLNHDGQDDKIVILRSPLHSGSAGDSFHILLNDNGSFNKIFNATIGLLYQDVEMKPVGSVRVLKSETNGYRDIEVIIATSRIMLKYNDGKYEANYYVSSAVSTQQKMTESEAVDLVAENHYGVDTNDLLIEKLPDNNFVVTVLNGAGGSPSIINAFLIVNGEIIDSLFSMDENYTHNDMFWVKVDEYK